MSKNFDSVKFIKQILKEKDPLIDTRPSTAYYDLFLKPQAYLLQPILDDSTRISESQSINYIDNMSDDDADALIDNYFISRHTGKKATGFVRFYFVEPVDITVASNTVVLSSEGLRFLSTDDISTTKEAMALSIEGGYYYITIGFIAAEYGSEYSVATDDIVAIEGSISNVVKVSNPSRFIGGDTRETSAQLKERASTAITVRNLLSKRSINTLLPQNFPVIKDLLSVGFYDPEMMRDIIHTDIDSTAYSIHVGGKTDIYIKTSVFTDATADTTAVTNIPASAYRVINETGETFSTTVFTDASADFMEAAVSAGHSLIIKSGVTAGTYAISSVTDGTSLEVSSTIPGTSDSVAYEIQDLSSMWLSPLIQITQVDRLDPGTLEPSGIYLYTGQQVLVDPKLSVSSGQDPEMVSDSTGAIHCVYENDSDIYYTKMSNAGNIIVSPTNISNSNGIARNPSIAIDSIDNTVIVWEDSDGASGNYEIFRIVLDVDGLITHAIMEVQSHTSHDYKHPAISIGQSGISIISIRNNTNAHYILLDNSDYSTELASNDVVTGSSSLCTPRIDSDDSYAYMVLNSDFTNINVYKINGIGGDEFLGGVNVATGGTNTLPDIKVDSSSNIFVIWSNSTSSIDSHRLSSSGNKYLPTSTTVLDFAGYSKSPRLYIDSSDKIHIAAIEDVNNSGDIHYAKYTQNYDILLENSTVQDQYNNSNYLALTVDQNRRPHIFWDSYDPYGYSLYYTKRQSQDYRIKVLSQNERYSMREIINIHIDDYFSSDYLRFSYEYANDIDTIDEYVASGSSLDRVTNADLLVKYMIPSFVDISIVYSGNDDLATTLITNYINNTSSYILSVSEIISALPISVSGKVTTPFTINTERHNIDGTIVSTSSNNEVEESRTTRFIARNIVVA